MSELADLLSEARPHLDALPLPWHEPAVRALPLALTESLRFPSEGLIASLGLTGCIRMGVAPVAAWRDVMERCSRRGSMGEFVNAVENLCGPNRPDERDLRDVASAFLRWDRHRCEDHLRALLLAIVEALGADPFEVGP